jgi:hypothetical protein
MLVKTKWQLLVNDQDGHGLMEVGSQEDNPELVKLHASNYEHRRDKRKKPSLYYVKRIEVHEEIVPLGALGHLLTNAK